MKTRLIYIITTFVFAWCTYAPCHAEAYEKHLKEMKIDDSSLTIYIYMDDDFANQEFTEKNIKKIYKKVTKDVHKSLPREYKHYNVRIYTKGTALENILSQEQQQDEKKRKKRRHGGWWNEIVWDENPWVTNISHPYSLSNALNKKCISVWASHGRYYDVAQNRWKWQRPNLFCTTEDMFTQTIVVPFLIPMLENAGANVFTPRERDWQTEEVIVDNDDTASGYSETNRGNRWETAASQGFAMPTNVITDGYNPFEKGTARIVRTSHNTDASKAIYKPNIPKNGRYAVYVSYTTDEKSVDDAHYVVWHQGMRTDYKVNQQIGGGTWVYLGTFDFDAGSNDNNRVEILSHSNQKGVITTDAVRFGGGMGNIERGGTTSGMPRCLEGARYYAQWAGLPYESLSLYKGTNDYNDDINVRSLMTNWLAGGSPYAPTKNGKKVPIDLSLAVHSDAGYRKDFKTIFGSLAVCTTDFNEGKLDADASRSHSKDFAQMLLDNSKKDIENEYSCKWTWRDLYDKNYSETRLPAMPSAIFETLSHQSFPDMKMGHDPNFKFTLARSIYKTILRYEAEAHGEKAIVQPLTPCDFVITTDTAGNAFLSWQQQLDKTETSAVPTSYNVYTAIGGNGYDNGTNTKMTHHAIHLVPDLQYRFRITAVNDGGESLPSEELSVVWHSKQAPTILVINGFQRLAAPQVVEEDSIKGFDMYADPGVSYGLTAGWCGKQHDFNITSPSFGYSTSEMEGTFISGNCFNYVAEHTTAIASAYRYNIVSCSRSAVEKGLININYYDAIDIILGNERNDGYSLREYKTFTPLLRNRLADYTKKSIHPYPTVTGRHALLISGSYIASDMLTNEEQAFLASTLHIASAGTTQSANSYVEGLQQTLALTNTLNPEHYATTRSDILQPLDEAFACMQYADGQTAAVAYQGAVPTFVMGFPFECITNSGQRSYTMRGIMSFLIK